MKKTIGLLLLCAPLWLAVSCTKDTPGTAQDYYRWLDDEQNGCVKTQRVNGVKVSVKYLPVEAVIARELGEQFNRKAADSLRRLYANTLTLLMTFAPDESVGAKGDIVFKGVSGKQEYTERMMTMNFGLQEQIRLQAGGKQWRPALTGLENTYSLGSSRSLVLAFPVPDDEREKIFRSDWILSYDDILYEMGILHFSFDHQQINAIPGFPGL